MSIAPGKTWSVPVLVLAVLGLAAIALPFVVSSYRTFQCTLVMIYAIALLGLNILTGYSGQISLGHGAFYAMGAYCTAILMDKLGVPYWATVPLAGAFCLVVGFLFGLPALRLEGLYLALATFALGVAMPQLLKYKALEGWTGGVQGIVILKPEAPAAFVAMFPHLHRFLMHKWYFDEFYDAVLVRPAMRIGAFLWHRGDEQTIDRFGPHGAAVAVGLGNKVTARLQSGYVYSYALVMLLGLIGATTWVFWWVS